jgi:SpoVK/Ycf46/Vps4 family AAA+-type ATPase
VRIDEINRLLSESFGGGNEVTQRLKGKLLTFMQENRAPILIIATANGISMMAQEFIRRFNYLVFVDIPTEDERKQIWTIHLEKKTTEESIERSALNYDLPLLARASDGFTGAEIESVVQKTKLSLLDSEKDDFDTDDLVNQCAMEVPLSMRSKDMLEDLRTWAMAYCTPATWTEGWETRKREALQRLEDMSKAPDTNVRRNRFLGLN